MTPPLEVARGFNVFPYRGLELADGNGATVRTRSGRTLIDAGGASYGTANVGHSHPHVQAALNKAANGLTHTSQAFAHPARSDLVERLLTFAGGWAERVFFSNSGTEAVETAIKTAMHHTGRNHLVAFEHGFHGRTLGALSATHEPRYRAPFEERLGETTFVSYGDVDALKEALSEDTAAVLVEPIQGEAGVRIPPDGFLPRVVEAAHAAGALTIVDEVQTGLGRTGHPLALHRDRVEPDLVCLAKSLAAGLPLGATIAHRRVDPLAPGLHGSTFGGNPLACRAALAVLDVLEREELAQHAAETGERWRHRLSALSDPLIREVRGRGLMIGIELGVRPTLVLQALQAEGVLALPGGDAGIRLLPPLPIEAETTDRVTAAIERALDRVRARYQEADP